MGVKLTGYKGYTLRRDNGSMKLRNALPVSLGLALVVSVPAMAQTAPAEPASEPAAAAKPAAKSPEKPPEKSANQLETVVVTGNNSEVEARRRSTASKIIIGREEIDKFGDSTVGEILKRLPGVTTQGAPGRGGPPRMRGLGGGYTQILIDGEPSPRGFSLDDLTPDQIERIEVMRAPTAETGARAIAGTINVVTRGGYSKRLNDVRLGLGLEHGSRLPMVSWTRNDTMGSFNYNFNLSANQWERGSDGLRQSVSVNEVTGESITTSEASQSHFLRKSLHATGRLQWRDERGNTLVLNPMWIVSSGGGEGASQLEQTGGIAPYSHTQQSSEGSFSTGRLGGQWTYRLGAGGNINARFGFGQTHWNSQVHRQNFDVRPGVNGLTETSADQRDRSLTSAVKFTRTLDNEHSLVLGSEFDMNRRVEAATTLQNGETPLSDFDGNLQARSTRAALFVQDEWALTPQWALHAGVRWEGILTRGSVAENQPEVSHRSSVTTPLVHAVWRPAPNSRDQVRMSLTRSYRSPDLQNLISRPTINSMFAGRGPNEEIHPDRAGNPGLHPELAGGLDVAIERYLSGGGMLSANVFVRRIDNLMRRVTALETVSWADVPRWVSRMQNIGSASTRGIELEAKFRLSELVEGAPKIDLRANASVFSSKVDGVPGPNNRLDQQPDGTLNLGGDYRLAPWPLTVGGGLNWTPAYVTQMNAQQESRIGRKRGFDAYALWTLSPALQLRVSANNLAPLGYQTGSTLQSLNALGQGMHTVTESLTPSYTHWQLRLEWRL